MPRTLWIVNHYAQAPDRPGPTRHYSLARRLAAHGWQCHILASSIELNTQRQRLEPGQVGGCEAHDGVYFHWLRSPGYEGSGAGRIWNMLHFAGALLTRTGTRMLPPPDAILGSSPHPAAAWSAARLAARHRVPFLFEIRDFWPEVLIQMGRLQRQAPAARALGCLERHLCRRAAAILCVVPFGGEYLRRYGVEEKVTWLPHGVDAALMNPVPRVADSGFTLTYLGAHGPFNALDTLLDAMAIVRQEPDGRAIRCRLIGAGPAKESLRERARGLVNVSFPDPVPRGEVGRLAADTDAFVLCTRDLPELFRLGLSMNKLFDYMAMGRPTILAAAPRNNPIAEAGAGLTVPPEQPAALAAAILSLARMAPAERTAMGERARAHARERYDYSILAQRLAERLDACVAAT